MKKNVLALSIATMIGGLGFAGAASAAVEVSPSGAGQVLVVPYFTAQAGNTTAFHITNTDKINGKAVKVRFRGASNSDDILDFQVFLSPGDVWTASVSADANGLAQLTTGDNSCTLPKITKGVPVPFIKDRLKGADAANNAETREGYIEILNMADITPDEVFAANGRLSATKTAIAWTGGTNKSALWTATKHVDGVAPCYSTTASAAVFKALESINPALNSVAHNAAITAGGGYTSSVNEVAASHGLAGSTGGLVGQWYVINVANSTTFSGTATAIRDTAITATTAGFNLYSPQTRGAAKLVSADPLIISGLLAAQHYDVPDLSTPLSGTFANALVSDTLATQTASIKAASAQAAALNKALGTTTVSNQYLDGAGVNATTDWVFSMPARRYIVAANYDATTTTGYGVAQVNAAFPGALVASTSGALTDETAGTDSAPTKFASRAATKAAAYRVYNLASGDATAAADISLFAADDANATIENGQICAVAKSQTFMDREETETTDGAVFSPGKATKLNVCGEVSVVTFGASSVLGASVSNTKATPGYAEGWGTVTFAAPVPVLGAAFTKASNPAASAGMMGNYGITWAHTK